MCACTFSQNYNSTCVALRLFFVRSNGLSAATIACTPAVYERSWGAIGLCQLPPPPLSSPRRESRLCVLFPSARARFPVCCHVFHTPFQRFVPPFVALRVSYTNKFFVFNSVAFFLFAVPHPPPRRSQSFSLPLRPSLAHAPPIPLFRAFLLSPHPPSTCVVGPARARLATHWWRSSVGLEQKYVMRNQSCIVDYQ